MELNEINNLDELDVNKVKVYTTDKDLINKIKVIEHNRGNGNIMANNFAFVSDNLKIKEDNKNMFYIQFLDNNHCELQSRYDSYVYSNGNKDAILNLLNALYTKEYIAIEACDLMYIMKNKSFIYSEYIIDESVDKINLNQHFNKINDNKSVILVFYGNENDYNYILNKVSEILKIRKGLCLYSFCKNDNHKKMSLFIEK